MTPQEPRTGVEGPLMLALALIGLAGFVDAVAFVRLSGLFVSFMSGNSTQIGVLPSLGRGWKAAAALGLVVLFVMGAFSGRLIGIMAGERRGAPLLSLVAALLLFGAVMSLALPPSGALVVSAAAMTLAMGLLNSAMAHADGVKVTPTYVTGTLVHLGHALADAVQGEAAPWRSYLLMWLALVVGALAGGMAVVRTGALALLIAAAWAALLALGQGAQVRRTGVE